MLILSLIDSSSLSYTFIQAFPAFMKSNSALTSDLRSNICAIVAGNQSRQQLNAFLRVCHALATTTLRRKIAAAMLQSRFSYASYADMAYDCIADLLQSG